MLGCIWGLLCVGNETKILVWGGMCFDGVLRAEDGKKEIGVRLCFTMRFYVYR